MNNNDPLRLQILTIVPDSWSLKKTAGEFNTTVHSVRKSKELKAANGILGEVFNKKGRILPDTVTRAVIKFYNREDNSRMMAGMTNTVLMKVNAEKQQVQKRYYFIR